MRQTFTKRILFFLFLVIPIPLILNLVVLSVFSFSTVTTNLMQTLLTKSSDFGLEFEKKLSIHRLFLKRLASTFALKGQMVNEKTFYAEAFSELQTLSDAEVSLCWLSPSEDRIYTKYSGQSFIQNLQQYPEIRKQLYQYAGKTGILTFPTPQPEHFLVIVENIGTLNSSGKNAGTLVAFYPMNSLKQDLIRSKYFEKEHICCVNQAGDVLFASAPFLTECKFSAHLPNLPELSPQKPNVTIQFAPKTLHTPNLLSMQIQNKTYLGLLLNVLPIEGTYTLALVPYSTFIFQALLLPINVTLFYAIAFSLMIWVLSRFNKKLHTPIQELITCMEATWRGNYQLRYEPQPYGYEINELGNIFNITLLLLLNSKEKAEVELVSGSHLQKELDILSSLQQELLRPSFPSLDYLHFAIHPLQSKQLIGQFYGWQTTENSFLSVFGLTGDSGLPSYLYALSARSLFLTYASLYDSIEEIAKKTNETFYASIKGNDASVSLTCMQYSVHTRTLSLFSIGETPPAVFLKHDQQWFHLFSPSTQTIFSGDILVLVTGDPLLSTILSELPINDLLQDSLHPLDSQNLSDLIAHMLNEAAPESEGSLYSFIFT